MYLVPIHVPIYVDGERRLVTSEWLRSLELLRESLEGRFGPIHVIAPSLDVRHSKSEQKLREMTESGDGVRLIPSFDLRVRARQFWLKERRRWIADLRRELPAAEVVHAGLDDVYRPISYAGFTEGTRAGKPTIFVQDTDIVLQSQELAAGQGMKRVARAWVYGRIFQAMGRRGVRSADLSLLKGTTLARRYEAYARNPRVFHDTSHATSDVLSTEALERRGRELQAGDRPRLVYCGRLVARKGVDKSLRLIKLLRDRGTAVEFDVIGDGPERALLESLTVELGLSDVVRFLGPVDYGPELLRDLASRHALLFTPMAEDTPRMIFDGYAAGLPLVAWDVAYVRERAADEGATLAMPFGDLERSADALAALLRDPGRLAELSRRAREAGLFHSSENWYRRRAEWTFEAVEKHRREAR